MPLRRARFKRPPAGEIRREPGHRLIRDAVEAEDLAVEWLHWIGIVDAKRVTNQHALGIRGGSVRADVSFDPLPMERDTLARFVQHSRAGGADLVVSFTFAGWTPDAFDWADEHDVPLVRFTFAGHLDPSNHAAEVLQPHQPPRTAL